MPLLYRKPFSPEKVPEDLKPDEEIFVCRHTNEVFRDYELFFKRTILCNSLVWSCKFTGKSGLTYQEALESERGLISDGMSLPEPIQRAVLTLVHHTHRGRLVNLCDEVYCYTKDRYQEGEIVKFQLNGKKRKGTVLRVIEPDDDVATGHSKSPKSKKSSEKLLSPKMKKVLEENSSPSKRSLHSSKKKNTTEQKPTTPKSKRSASEDNLVSPKNRKHSNSSEKLKSPKMSKSPNRKNVIVIDGGGENCSKNKREESVFKFPVNGTNDNDQNESLWPDATLYHYEIRVTPIKFLKKKEGKKDKDEIVILPASEVSRKKGVVTRDRLKLFLKATCMRSTPSSEEGYWIVQEEYRKKFDLGDLDPDVQLLLKSPPTGKKSRKRKVDGSQSDIISQSADDMPKKKQKRKSDEKEAELLKNKERKEKQFEIKKSKLTPEERQRLLDEEKEKRKQAIEEEKEKRKQQKEIEKAQKEEEKMKRKLERDKEREKLKEKKRMEALLLKEWSKPREDLELDDLKSLPEPEPVKTKVPLDMFGDAVMVVEFLNAFGHLFDIKDEFPSGFTFALLEDALYEHDAEGVYYDLMQFLLGAILRTHLEEEEDEGLAGNQHIKPPSDYDGEDNHHAAVSASATMAAAWSMLHQGKQLHELIMDPFTCSELLRLHLLSSGVRIGCEDEEFRWQSRGGFTFNDDVVVEFRHKEPGIIRQLLTTCVYDMEPRDKLKILLALCGQLMTYSTTRDFMEECFDKCKKARRDWQDDQWREQRQEREEAAARYKKRMEERAKQKEELEKKKKEKEQGKEEEGKKSGALQNGASNETKDGEKQQEEKSKENKGRQKRDNSEEESKNKDKRAKSAAKDVREGEHVETAAVTKEEEEEQARVRKVEKKKKEQEYLEALRHTSAASNIQPLGRDRLFRRYWVFQSLKGLFVEDNDPNLPLFLASEQDMKESTGLQADVQDKKQLAVSDDQLIKNENKSSGHVTPQNTDTPDDKLPTVKSGGVLVNGDVTLLSKTSKCDPAIAKILKTNKILLSDLPSHGLNQLVSDTENLDSKSIYRNRNILKWGFFKTQEELDSLLSTLNPRGLREKSLREALQLEYDMIVKAIEKCPFRTEENLKKESFKTKQKKGANRAQVAVDKSRYQTMEAFLEANLRDQILDIEDRIWQGSLGCIKVSDREAWRNKVENGIYHILSSTNNTTETLNGQEEPMEVDGKRKCEKDIFVSENAGNGDVSCAFKEDLMDNRSHVLANSVTNGTSGKPHVDSDDTEVEQLEKNRIFKIEEFSPASSVPSRLELTKTQQSACLLGSRSATPTNGTTSLFLDPVTKELAHALLKVEQGIEAKFLAPPFGEDEDTKKEKQREDTVSEKKERKEKKENKKDKENEKERNQGETADDKDNKQEEVNDDCSSNSSDEPVKQHKTVLERWEESLLACTSFSQVFVHLNTLDQSITWSKSVLNARCRLCRRKGDAEHMLLCDGCDRGHHMYCLKPPITEIPEGDWFCNDCRPKEPRRSERRRKPVIEEDDEEDSGEEDDTEEYDVEEESDDESDSDFDEDDESVVQEEEQSEAESEHGDTCAFCGEVGELLCCETCPLAYHLSCAYPPLRRIPRGNWACQVCTGADEDLPRGRRVKKAIIKAAEKRARPIQIGKSAKSKRQTRAKRPEKKNTKVRVGLESSRDSSVEGRRKTKRRKISASSSSRCSTPEPRRSCTAIKIRGRASLDSKARDPKLNSRLSKCEKLLKELSSAEEAEYFMEPVDAVKHPDYHQFVKDPIDFGTIQKNLAQRAYDSVEDFAADVRRVFINCSEYFRPRAKEARAGIKLSASFETMFSDMGLDSSSIPTTRSRRN